MSWLGNESWRCPECSTVVYDPEASCQVCSDVPEGVMVGAEVVPEQVRRRYRDLREKVAA